MIDANGQIHDHTEPIVHTPLEEEQIGPSGGGGQLIIRANPRSGAITELEFNNHGDRIGYFLFELRYRNGTYSKLHAVQVAPNTVATMDRSTMAQLGIRNAVGLGNALVEVSDTFWPNTTAYDADGNLIALQPRHHTVGCPPAVT